MFISRDEKLQINERLEALSMALIEASEKSNDASAKAETAMENIPNIRATIKSLMDNIWDLNAKLMASEERADQKIKEAEQRINEAGKLMKGLQNSIDSLKSMDDMLHRSTKSLFASVANLASRKPLGRPPKTIVIQPESVQALKDAGVWEDPTNRAAFISRLVKESRDKKTEEQKDRKRQYYRNYYQRKKAEKLAKETT